MTTELPLRSDNPSCIWMEVLSKTPLSPPQSLVQHAASAQSSVFFHSMEERGCVHKQKPDPVWSTRGMSGILSYTLAALWAWDDVTHKNIHTGRHKSRQAATFVRLKSSNSRCRSIKSYHVKNQHSPPPPRISACVFFRSHKLVVLET